VIVVSNSSPLHYLILIQAEHLLPSLYVKVFIPDTYVCLTVFRAGRRKWYPGNSDASWPPVATIRPSGALDVSDLNELAGPPGLTVTRPG
jgi:hypothetical protein